MNNNSRSLFTLPSHARLALVLLFSIAELFVNGTAATPHITGASISGKKLLVEGQN